MEAETETLPLWEMPLVQVHCDMLLLTIGQLCVTACGKGKQSWLVNSGSWLGFSLTWAAMSTSWGSLRYLPSPSFKKSSKLPKRQRHKVKPFFKT